MLEVAMEREFSIVRLKAGLQLACTGYPTVSRWATFGRPAIRRDY
jgi:hypothetical protein